MSRHRALADAEEFAVVEISDRLDRLFCPSSRAQVLSVCGRPGADMMGAAAWRMADTLSAASSLWGSAVLFGAVPPAGVAFSADGPVVYGWRHAVRGSCVWDLVPALSDFSRVPEELAAGYGSPDGLASAPEFVALRRLREVAWMVSAARSAGVAGSSAAARARAICSALIGEGPESR